MNENTTFFRNRNEDSGETYQFSLKTAHGSQGFSVYCRRPLQSKWFSDGDSAQRDAASFSKKLHEVVATKGGGGVVVTVSGENGRRTVEVKQVGRDAVAPANRFVMLAPGIPAQFLPIAAKHQLPPGTHAIVPIDADAEERLAGFVEQLPWFSPDFETLVLNAIRRPSLDARLSSVETRLFGQSQEEPPPRRGWPQIKLRLRKALSKPATYAIAVLILLTLLLAGNGYLLWDLRSKIDKGTPAPSAGAAAATDTSKNVKKTEPEKISNASARETLVTKTKELLQELRASKNANIQTLYRDHFKDFNEKSTDEEIKSWFDVQKPPEGEEGSRPLLWGIIKLQALALQPKDMSFLKNARTYTATTNIINKSKDTKAIHLATVLECRLGYDDKSLFTPPKAECDKVKDDDIKNGLSSLVEFVKNPK